MGILTGLNGNPIVNKYKNDICSNLVIKSKILYKNVRLPGWLIVGHYSYGIAKDVKVWKTSPVWSSKSREHRILHVIMVS